MPLKKGLLISIGTGIGDNPQSILHAIHLSISERNPNFVAFVVSEQSKKNAQSVAEELELSHNQYEFFEILDPNDLDECVQKTEEGLKWLLSQGLGTHEIIADFTSGTKPMSSAMVLIAFQKDIASLSYVQGKREKGIVKKGTEKVVSFRPIISKIYSKIDEAYNSLLIYQFDIAKSIIKNCQSFKDLMSEDLKAEIDYLENIINGYHSWDLFKHHEAKDFFDKARIFLKNIKRKDLTNLYPGKEIVRHLGYLGNLIGKKEKNPAVVADLLANASRRIKEGKYDDATARLYRIFELIGQTILFLEYRLDSSDLDLDEIRNKLKDKFRNWKDVLQRDTDGKIKIGARKVYELLDDLGHPIGKKVELFKRLLAQRNNSILAHGLVPIRKEKAKEFFEKIFELCKETFDAFELLYQKSTFP